MKFKVKTFIAIITVIFGLQIYNSVSARSYPIKDCPINNGSGIVTLSLPIINNADYYSYKNKYVYRKIYSMLRLSTYKENRDVGNGSHQGVDFACEEGTSVYAAYDGTVIVAGELGKRGNVIVIKHEWQNQIYYTVYAHLSSISVNAGDFVAEGLKIGEVGDTGNSTGPHLHFQIEINQDGNHPFFPTGCEGSIDEIVNNGNCIDQIMENTLDPIVFLEQTTKFVSHTTTPVYVNSSEIILSGFLGGFMEVDSLQTISIQKSGNGGSLLSTPISISVNSGYLSSSPSKIQTIAGNRSSFLHAKNKTGFTIVSIKYGNINLKRFPVIIGTSGEIASRRQNKTLISALQQLGINV